MFILSKVVQSCDFLILVTRVTFHSFFRFFSKLTVKEFLDFLASVDSPYYIVCSVITALYCYW